MTITWIYRKKRGRGRQVPQPEDMPISIRVSSAILPEKSSLSFENLRILA